MRNISAIAGRELAFLFNSPIAYIAITVFLAICGVYLFVMHDFFGANQADIRPLLEQIPLFFILYVPAISMRLISEEKRSGTVELLATWPVTDVEIVVGKFMGAMGFLLVTLAMSLVFPILVGQLGVVDTGAVMGGYLGLILVGAAYLAMGLLTSSWTENQIVSFILAVLLCTFFYSIDGLVGSFWEAGRDGFAALSFRAHFANIARGVIDSRDVIFYLSFIALALFMTVQSLQARRWR